MVPGYYDAFAVYFEHVYARKQADDHELCDAAPSFDFAVVDKVPNAWKCHDIL